MASEGTFDANVFFNYDRFLQHDTYISYVRDSENYSVGGLNPGFYNRMKDFQMILVSKAENEEGLNEQLALMSAHASQFMFVVMEW